MSDKDFFRCSVTEGVAQDPEHTFKGVLDLAKEKEPPDTALREGRPWGRISVTE